MKLKFKSITVANFMKYGNGINNLGTTTTLDSHKVTYVAGANGSGKSSGISDAICFAIANKAYRPISKPLLVNSINRKNCRVELVFEKDADTYKVIRGIKPNIFEIYKNDVLINPPTDTRDYQQILEDQILGGFSFKTFAQVVMLGSAGYEPFLELKPDARRDVVETILDIGIFSEMNEKNKLLLTKLKQQERELSIKVKEKQSSLESLTDIQKSLSADLSSKKVVVQGQVNDLTKLIDDIDLKIFAIENGITSFDEKISKFGNVNGKLSKFDSAKSMLNSKVNALTNEVIKYESMDTCQTCMQPVGEAHKQNLTSAINSRKESILSELHTVSGQVVMLSDAVSKVNALITKRQTLSNELNQLHRTRQGHVATKVAGQQQIMQLERPKNMDDVSDKIKAEEVILESLKDTYTGITDELATAMAASKLLNDSGVKSTIIAEYLPILNHFINKNLDKMNLFVNITLDESFDVKFKARHRDDFSFYSFSEGEKARINIAILFAWRDLAKAKNSINTNLLILDELFSSAVDETGLGQLQELLLSMDDVNIFVMSHSSTSMIDNFSDRTLTMTIENNFTKVEES